MTTWETLGPLAGVMIGGGIGWLGSWSQIQHGRREARRRELLDIVAQFIGDAYLVSAAREELGLTIAEMMVNSGNRSPEYQRELWDRRAGYFEVMKDSRKRMECALAEIRILRPKLATAAESLSRQSTRQYTLDNSDELTAARDAAQHEFETLARRLLK